MNGSKAGNGQRQRVVLTGASRGIGHATVKRFSDEGWEIITCSRDEVPAECRRDPNWTHHITADLADPEAVVRFLTEAERSEDHTSDLLPLLRSPYAVYRL